MVDVFLPCGGLQANTSSAGEKNEHVRWRAERGPGAKAGVEPQRARGRGLFHRHPTHTLYLTIFATGRHGLSTARPAQLSWKVMAGDFGQVIGIPYIIV
jgi:hypothetical protein